MSEYQYYEFQALERPLTQHEMRELRKYSTRATITEGTHRPMLRLPSRALDAKTAKRYLRGYRNLIAQPGCIPKTSRFAAINLIVNGVERQVSAGLITTFIARESEVKIVDPSRISLTDAHGCKVKFMRPTE